MDLDLFMATASKHIQALTLSKKLEILTVIESCKYPNFTEIGKQFDVHRSTVSKILKHKEMIKSSAKALNLIQKRNENFREEDVDEALFYWFKQQVDRGVLINGHLLRTKAIQLAAEMGNAFEPSDGWLNRFKTRHNLSFKQEFGYRPMYDQGTPKDPGDQNDKKSSLSQAENQVRPSGYLPGNLPELKMEPGTEDLSFLDNTGSTVFEGSVDGGESQSNLLSTPVTSGSDLLSTPVTLHHNSLLGNSAKNALSQSEPGPSNSNQSKNLFGMPGGSLFPGAENYGGFENFSGTQLPPAFNLELAKKFRSETQARLMEGEGGTPGKTCQQGLTLAQKLEIVRVLEECKSPNYTVIGKMFGIHRSTVSKIAKKKEIIRDNAKDFNLNQTRIRKFKETDVDEALLLWFRQYSERGGHINGQILRAKATQLAAGMGSTFEPSDGWLNRFKTRHNLTINTDPSDLLPAGPSKKRKANGGDQSAGSKAQKQDGSDGTEQNDKYPPVQFQHMVLVPDLDEESEGESISLVGKALSTPYDRSVSAIAPIDAIEPIDAEEPEDPQSDLHYSSDTSHNSVSGSPTKTTTASKQCSCNHAKDAAMEERRIQALEKIADKMDQMVEAQEQILSSLSYVAEKLN